jgi:surfeit locus 1 family protein
MAATLFLLALASLFAALGTWQSKRAAEKTATQQLHETAVQISLEQAINLGSRFSRVDASGHYDTARHILLDNQIWRGRAGVFVFTPFYTVTGSTILVNRGWLPLGAERKNMPDIPTPKETVVLKGMLNIVPVPGRILGEADKLKQDQWPQLVTYLNLADISDSLGVPLENWVVQLSASEDSGFNGRDWKPVYLSPDRHRAYAFQWFALTLLSIVMWLVVSFRKSTGKRQ